MTGQFKSATPRALSEEITIGVGSKLAQRPTITQRINEIAEKLNHATMTQSKLQDMLQPVLRDTLPEPAVGTSVSSNGGLSEVEHMLDNLECGIELVIEANRRLMARSATHGSFSTVIIMTAHPCNDCDPTTGLRKPCPECKPVIAGQAMTRPMSAADHERALAMIEQRTDLNDEQRAMMRASVEKHYLNATLNG